MKQCIMLTLALILCLALAACSDQAAKPIFNHYDILQDVKSNEKPIQIDTGVPALYIVNVIFSCLVSPLLQIVTGVLLLIATKHLSKRTVNRKMIIGFNILGSVFLLYMIIIAAESLNLLTVFLCPS